MGYATEYDNRKKKLFFNQNQQIIKQKKHIAETKTTNYALTIVVNFVLLLGGALEPYSRYSKRLACYRFILKLFQAFEGNIQKSVQR